MKIQEYKFPDRGFNTNEFKRRLERIQFSMVTNNIEAILLTTKVDIHYFSGIVSQFWESPTRPVYLIIPAIGDSPIAVIPDIFYESMNLTWVKDITCWSSPCIEDDGISLLIEKLKIYKNIGMPMGIESQLRMPLSHILLIMKKLNTEFIDASPLIQQVRLIKSPAEIEKIRTACQITSKAFEYLSERVMDLTLYYEPNKITERQIIMELHKDIIERGADKVPFIVGNCDYNGSRSIIDGPRDLEVLSGNIMIIDVGCVYDEYYCDFNRNFAINYSNPYIKKANMDLWYATESALAITRPGITFGDLWKAQADYLISQGYEAKFFETVRLGHSIGLSLTELPSIIKDEKTKLMVGVVLTLEPSLPLENEKILVHEECLTITETGYELLSIRAPIDFYYLNLTSILKN
jgi:Xaa-Pro aminopeptidase